MDNEYSSWHKHSFALYRAWTSQKSAPASKSTYWITVLPYLRSCSVRPGVLLRPTVLEMYSSSRFISIGVHALDLWTPCSLLSALRMNIKSPARDVVQMDGCTLQALRSQKWIQRGKREGFRKYGLRENDQRSIVVMTIHWWDIWHIRILIFSVTFKGHVVVPL